MIDNATSVLTSRLHALADDLTPPLDVVGQVRAARTRHSRQRRGRIALLAVATATAAVVVGSVAAADLLAATPSRGEVAVPSTPAPTTAEAAPTTPPPAETTGLPAGWEPRTFEGVEFAVPPGARMADTVDMRPVNSFMDGPSLTWNGPALGGGEYSYVKVMVVATFEAGLTPVDGGEWFTVPGAESAYGGIDTTDHTGAPTGTTTLWMHLLDGDRQIVVDAQFPVGETGMQMARDVIASLSVTGETPTSETGLPAGWEPRSFEGVTFAVPPGARAADTVDMRPVDSFYDGPTLTWNGPALGDGEYTHVKVMVAEPFGGDTGEGEWFTVPGADAAYGSVYQWTGTEDRGSTVASTNFWLLVDDGDRTIQITGTFPAGEAGEQMARDLIGSIAVE